MKKTPRVTYGIEAIHDCIVQDTDIHRKYSSKGEKASLYRKKEKMLAGKNGLNEMISAGFVRSLDKRRGRYVGKVGWMPSALVIADQRIRELCRNMFMYTDEYFKKTGLRFGPCPGLEKMSGCPMFSTRPEEIRKKLDDADIFIAMQSKEFVRRPGIPGWHDYLLRKLKKEIESLLGKGAVTSAFGAGPCQFCHPKKCLGKGDCRAPDMHLFSLESVGVPVGELCKDMALLTGDDDWKIKWIKFYNTPLQTSKHWKLTSGLAVNLTP